MFLPLDGPSKQGSISVTTGTVVEAKIGPSALLERKVMTIQPISDSLYVFFGDDTDTVPTVEDMEQKGFRHYRGVRDTYEAGQTQKIYLLAMEQNTQVIIAERA